MLQKTLAPLILSCLLGIAPLEAFSSPASDAHPVLTFLVTRQVTTAEGDSKASTKEAFPLKVTLDKQVLILEAKDAVTIYNFDQAREFELDEKQKTFQEYSLYSNVGFRVLEFYNRVNLRKMMQKANLGKSFADLAQIEQLFSLTAEQSDTVIDSAESDGSVIYSSKQNVLMTVSRKSKPLPSMYQHEYWRFMRYYVGGHPDIYKALEGLSGVPTRVVVELRDNTTETRTLELQSIQLTSSTVDVLAGYTRASPTNDPFVSAALVRDDAPTKVAARYAQARINRDDAYSQGNFLGAMLAYDEMSLSTGLGEPEWLKMAHDRLTADPMVSRLIRAVSMGSPAVHDENAQQQALDDFKAIRVLKPVYVDTVDIFEGNVRIALRDDRGRQLLFDALAINPYLIGAWHDLGDQYYRAFRLQEAWTCWDAARRISSTSPMMKPVDQMEQTFRSKNPQLF